MNMISISTNSFHGRHKAHQISNDRGFTFGRARQSAKSAKHRKVGCLAAMSSKDLEKHREKVILIDNYDSFTYNLSQYLGQLGCDHSVLTNDSLTVEQLDSLNPKGLLLSPGPGAPEDAGITLEVIKKLSPKYSIFGVCMGHQCIGQTFGAKVIRCPEGVRHGKSSPIYHNNEGVFKGLANPFKAARYHSLVIDKSSNLENLEITAWTEDGIIMGVRHKDMKHIEGVQFHPESIITDYGMDIMRNFVDSLK